MRRASALVLAGAVAVLGPLAPAASADDLPVDRLPAPTEQQLAESVTALDPRVSQLEGRVTGLATETTDGGDEVITLASDILFAFDRSDLSPRAAARIRGLVEDVPRRARVSIGGHTDALGSVGYNLRLSTARARAVAAVVRRSRPDLRLTVRGFGETRPVAPNTRGGEDDPEGRAENRRVEIRYAG
ncbi:OmpA family protein [Phycicoccus flavus]|uniref:OmpA family protein n=1 Tax=Phycicoccus flavus TaxID=2502783 RepID=A0A8T6R139_9MICO|nr:OmpA family protein [Phycicoccus flavus]NHA67200.1 OmpA family protein [Phycicoccus flavus]